MIGFEFTEHIERSPQEVFAVLTDPTRAVDCRGMVLPLVAAMAKKEDGDHLARLKAYIESQQRAQTAS